MTLGIDFSHLFSLKIFDPYDHYVAHWFPFTILRLRQLDVSGKLGSILRDLRYINLPFGYINGRIVKILID